MLNKETKKDEEEEENWEVVDDQMEMEQQEPRSSRPEEVREASAEPRLEHDSGQHSDEQQATTPLGEESTVQESNQVEEVAEEETTGDSEPLLEVQQSTNSGQCNESNTRHHPTQEAPERQRNQLLDTAAIGKSFRRASRKIGNKVKDIDRRHKIRETTVSSVRSVGSSARALGKSVRLETTRVGDSMKRSYVENDVEGKAKAAAEKVKETTVKVGRKVKRFNEKYRVTEKIAAAGVMVGALRLARGDRRGGTSALAVAGASYMAGEAMRTPAQSTELNEDLHLE